MDFPYSDYDLDVLKKTVWLEARGEPHEGKVAVAHVIISRARANRGYFGGNTVSGVCLHPQQFEPWNNQRPENVHPQGDGWETMEGWVREVLAGRVGDPTGGSLYFNNPDKEGYPEWTKNVKRGVKIENHQFYNE